MLVNSARYGLSRANDINNRRRSLRTNRNEAAQHDTKRSSDSKVDKPKRRNVASFLQSRSFTGSEEKKRSKWENFVLFVRLLFSRQGPLDDMYHLQLPRTGKPEWLYISCVGRYRHCWDFISLIAVLYCTFSVPYDMCFNPPSTKVFSCVDIAIEAFFMTDVVSNFFTSYQDHCGEVTSKFMIALNYCRSWLLIDAVSSIPSEIITQIADSLSSAQHHSNLAVLNRLRIIRILRLTKLLRLLRLNYLIEAIQLRFPMLEPVLGLFRLIFMMMLVAHLQACIFYYVATLNIQNSWISKFHFNCCNEERVPPEFTGPPACFDAAMLPSLMVLYINSLYWAFTTLTSVGYGDITPCNYVEFIYTTCSMVIGSGIFAYVVGNIAAVVSTQKGSDIRYKTKLKDLQEYLTIRTVPKSIAFPILQQCMNQWSRSVYDEEFLLREVNGQLRREMISAVHGSTLFGISLFSDIAQENEDFMIELSLKMGTAVFMKDECLDLSDFEGTGASMYAVKSGTVTVTSDEVEGKKVENVPPGGILNFKPMILSVGLIVQSRLFASSIDCDA
eukprot:753705-Hanusia_phi.AAC.3